MALDEVAAEPVLEADRALQVDLVPGLRDLRLECRRVSPITSAVKPSVRTPAGRRRAEPVTVRQTPLTQIESPVRASSVTTVLRT